MRHLLRTFRSVFERVTVAVAHNPAKRQLKEVCGGCRSRWAPKDGLPPAMKMSDWTSWNWSPS